jgi:putative nucleotidyltransferase with HDIG domain
MPNCDPDFHGADVPLHCAQQYAARRTMYEAKLYLRCPSAHSPHALSQQHWALPIHRLNSRASFAGWDTARPLWSQPQILALFGQWQAALLPRQGAVLDDADSFSIIDALITLQQSRDPYTVKHQHNVGLLSQAMGQELGHDAQYCQRLFYCGLAHDLGKMAVPLNILHSPVPLTDHEKNIIRGHAAMGYELLKHYPFSFPLAEIVGQHHERMDGSGYPLGLSAEQIHPEAKIIIVADMVESMALPRSYRPALGIEYALAEISKDCGKALDSAACQAVLRIFQQGDFSFALK